MNLRPPNVSSFALRLRSISARSASCEPGTGVSAAQHGAWRTARGAGDGAPWLEARLLRSAECVRAAAMRSSGHTDSSAAGGSQRTRTSGRSERAVLRRRNRLDFARPPRRRGPRSRRARRAMAPPTSSADRRSQFLAAVKNQARLLLRPRYAAAADALTHAPTARPAEAGQRALGADSRRSEPGHARR
jgi:hypothetical protein